MGIISSTVVFILEGLNTRVDLISVVLIISSESRPPNPVDL